jgi:hypothetical protein
VLLPIQPRQRQGAPGRRGRANKPDPRPSKPRGTEEELEPNTGIPRDYIDSLTQRITNSITRMHYMSGPLRCNYVYEHRSKWKTTICAYNQNQGISCLIKVLSLLDQRVQRQRLSTTKRRDRDTALLVQNPKIRQRGQNQSLNRVAELHLDKVVLIQNGNLGSITVLLKKRNE